MFYGIYTNNFTDKTELAGLEKYQMDKAYFFTNFIWFFILVIYISIT